MPWRIPSWRARPRPWTRSTLTTSTSTAARVGTSHRSTRPSCSTTCRASTSPSISRYTHKQRRPCVHTYVQLPSSFLSSIPSPQTTPQYETLESPDIDLDALLGIFDRIPNLAFITDYAYRIYGSVRILWKFRTQTALKLPTVDLRRAAGLTGGLSRSAEACVDVWQALNPRRLLVRLLASRYLPYMLLAGVLLPLLVYGVLLYVAAYRDYQRGCVFNTNPRGAWERVLGNQHRKAARTIR